MFILLDVTEVNLKKLKLLTLPQGYIYKGCCFVFVFVLPPALYLLPHSFCLQLQTGFASSLSSFPRKSQEFLIDEQRPHLLRFKVESSVQVTLDILTYLVGPRRLNCTLGCYLSTKLK